MCEDRRRDGILRDFLGGIPAITGGENRLQMRRIRVRILEMEDVLFHLNSAVMMPCGPQGVSSTDGTDDDATDTGDAEQREAQQNVTGFEVLALTYRQFEINPRLKLVITGNTDTSGTFDFNYTLSELRGQNVQYLLEGRKEEWAEVSTGRHRIEDYQTIMKYFAVRHPDWNCDPGKIDNKWGPNTKQASANFFSANGLPPTLADEVDRVASHPWPAPAWEAVFELYCDEIARLLNLPSGDHLDGCRARLHFVDTEKKSVGCGESFPVDDAERDNYRSQNNRRVELFFFEHGEAPERMDCSLERNRAHTTEECPIRSLHHFTPIYVNPADLTSVAYHIKFMYYDRIKRSLQPVPAGLVIGAFETVGGRTREVQSTTDYTDGVYIVQVQDNPDREGIHFEIDDSGQKWVFTENDGATPQIVARDIAEVRELPWAERITYYDLPQLWSSRNYWVRTDADQRAGRRFNDAMNNRNIKPYGDNETSLDEPVIFCLDDVVLVNSAGLQNIRDLDESDDPIDLSDDADLTLFYLDPDSEYELNLYNSKDDHKEFSDIEFSENLITDVPPFARIICFCSKFYSITDKRTLAPSGFSYDDNHILGARAAVVDDTDVHAFEHVHVNFGNGSAPYDYVQSNCGNYELHYFHACGTRDDKELSYLMIYWYCRYYRHASDPPTTRPDWYTKWKKYGGWNAMARTNRPYKLILAEGSKDIVIRTFPFYEGKNYDHGGSRRVAVNICEDEHAWMLPTRSEMQHGHYRRQVGYYSDRHWIHNTPGDNYQDVDGRTYSPLTSHHELGHATGCFDDYLYSLKVDGETYGGIPSFNQPYTAPGGPYHRDTLARMFHNRSPRMRNFWHFVNWVNDKAGSTLDSFLDGSRYKMAYKFTKDGSEETIELDLTNARYRDTCSPSYQNLNFEMGDDGKADLLLYKTGGETARTLIRNHVFDAILVVRSMLEVRFDRSVADWFNGRNWTKQDRRNWIVQNLLVPITENFEVYYWECPEASDFKKTLMIFSPFFWIGNPPSEYNPHFRIDVQNLTGTNFRADDDRVRVGKNADHHQILDHILGQCDTDAHHQTTLAPIGTWLGGPTIGNGTFAIHKI